MNDDDAERVADYREWFAEDERREKARSNGQHPDDPGDDEPPDVDDHHAGEYRETDDANSDEPTTWEPVDLGPYLRGEVKHPQPSIGMRRTDGMYFIYPGREHALVGVTESAKTWFALGCIAAELSAGHYVINIHYEESDPISTIERLRLLGVGDDQLVPPWFRFIGPYRPVRTEWVEALLTPAPTLVVHDGVNEAMSLIGAEIEKVDGASLFRRRLITPFLRVGAATIACDHLPLNADASRTAAYGSVHKGNALDGARILLENREPFGRGLRGVSHVYVTKDRPGYLRAHGSPDSKIPGKTYMGTLVGDDSNPFEPFSLMFYAHRDNADDHGAPAPAAGNNQLADDVWQVIAAQPDRQVASERELYAVMRKAGHKFTNADVNKAVDDLIVDNRLRKVFGKNNSKGYEAVTSASDTRPE